MIAYKKYVIPVLLTAFLSTSGYIVLTQAAEPIEKSYTYNETLPAQAEEKNSIEAAKLAEEKTDISSKQPAVEADTTAKPENSSIIERKTTSPQESSHKEVSLAQAQLQTSVKRPSAQEVSRNTSVTQDAALPWFGQAEEIFYRGAVAEVTDVATGLKFKVKRTYGYNHADCETLTLEDTTIMKQIYGGSWSWVRRAVIVEVDGRKIAASMTGMPHAGRDDQPANSKVNDRSEGYGYGDNLDTVKGNGMDGHFDIHFLGSKTHGTNKVDPQHQAMVKEAAAVIR